MGAAARRQTGLATGRGGQSRSAETLRITRFLRALPLPLPSSAGRLNVEADAKKILLVAAVALVDADGRVLLAQRPEGKTLAGLWEFPGGKVEPGETPEETLIRELRKDLGIDRKIPCPPPLTCASHDYDDFHLLM